VRVALGQESAVDGGEILLGGGGAEALEELRPAVAEDPDDGVVQRLSQVERVPIGGEQHLQRALVALGQDREDLLQPVLARMILDEGESRLEHGALDLLHARLRKRGFRS